MFAAFLKTEDGYFEYGPAFGALIFTLVVLMAGCILYGALKKGRIPFSYSGKYVNSKKLIGLNAIKIQGGFGLLLLFTV